jgi:hypothetical protein
LDQIADGGFVTDIGPDEFQPIAGIEFPKGSLRGFLIDSADTDPHSPLKEEPGNPMPDTSFATGDNCNFIS